MLRSQPALDSGPHWLEHKSVQPRPHDWQGQGRKRARNPLELNVGGDRISRPLSVGFEPVDELRVEAPFELFQPDLLGRDHHHDVNHLAFGRMIHLDGLLLTIIGEESHAADRGGEQPRPAFVVGIERRQELGRCADLCGNDGVDRGAASSKARSVECGGNRADRDGPDQRRCPAQL